VKQHRKTRGVQRWSGIVALLGVLVAAMLMPTDFLERWELRSQDLRFTLRGPRPTSARIVLAVIADSTLEAWSEPMNAWGPHYRQAIRQAEQSGVTWIGLDMIPGVSGDAMSDQAFARALAGGKVILSNVRTTSGRVINPIPSLLYAHVGQAQNIGYVNTQEERDEIVRRASVFQVDGKTGTLLPSFPAVLALRSKGQLPVDPSALRALLSPPKPPGTRSAEAANDGRFWINFVGPPYKARQTPGADGEIRDTFTRFPIEKLAAGTLTPEQRETLLGAVMLIGPTYIGANDVQRGPGRPSPGDRDDKGPGDAYDGVEIHANALATLLDGRPLRRASGTTEAAVTVTAGLLASLVAVLLPFGWGLATVLALGALWMSATVKAFAADQLWPMVGPLLAMGLSWSGYHTARSVEEARRRLWLQGVFGRFVTPDIVTHFMRHPEALELGGVEFDVTVMFIDLRGHTTAAQGRSPAGVLEELNGVFAEVVPVIDRHGGLVLGYRGDGLLAVFGAPRILQEHARAAVTAAITMARATRQVSAARSAAGEAPVRLGCGINTGRVVAGNIGVYERSEYTVIGDAVNIAARLEGLNKEPVLNDAFPSEVVISQATYDCLTDPPPTRGPFEFEIRGREGRMFVYQVRIE
jgi:adenylate cyclase